MTTIDTIRIKDTSTRWLVTNKWLAKHARRGWGSPKITKAEEQEIEKHKKMSAAQASELFKCYLGLIADLCQMWFDSDLTDEMLETSSRIDTEDILERGSSLSSLAYYNFKIKGEWRSFGIALVTQDAGSFDHSEVLRISCDPFDNSRTLRFGVANAKKIEEWTKAQMQEMIDHVQWKIKQKQDEQTHAEKAEEWEQELTKAGYNVKVTTVGRRDFGVGIYDKDDLLIGETHVNHQGDCHWLKMFPVDYLGIGGFLVETARLEFKGSMPIHTVLKEMRDLIKA